MEEEEDMNNNDLKNGKNNKDLQNNFDINNIGQSFINEEEILIISFKMI